MNVNVVYIYCAFFGLLWLPNFSQSDTCSSNGIYRVFFLTCQNWSSIKSFKIKILRSSLLHIVVWSLWFCYIYFVEMWDVWSSCFILSNKNAQIEKVINITSENHTLLDLFVAMSFDAGTFFRDGIEENICYT